MFERISPPQTCLWLEVALPWVFPWLMQIPCHLYFCGHHFSNSHGSAFPVAPTLPHSWNKPLLKNSRGKRSLRWEFKTCATNPSMAKVTICCSAILTQWISVTNFLVKILTGQSKNKLWPSIFWRWCFYHKFCHNWGFSVTIGVNLCQNIPLFHLWTHSDLTIKSQEETLALVLIVGPK